MPKNPFFPVADLYEKVIKEMQEEERQKEREKLRRKMKAKRTPKSGHARQRLKQEDHNQENSISEKKVNVIPFPKPSSR